MHFWWISSAPDHKYWGEHQHYRWKTTERDQHDYRSRFCESIGVDRSRKLSFRSTLRVVGSDCLWWGWTKFLLITTTDVSGQLFVAWRNSELYMTFSMSGMWVNLMFSGGMNVVLEYCTILAIIDDSFSKRTMKVMDLGFLVMCESARWTMVFKLR